MRIVGHSMTAGREELGAQSPPDDRIGRSKGVRSVVRIDHDLPDARDGSEIGTGAVGRVRNVVLILADDQSNHAGYLGTDGARTPQIDKLAAEGVNFTRGFTACAVCSPSRGAVLTGVHPDANGLRKNVPNYGLNFPLPSGSDHSEEGHGGVNEDIPTLIEILNAHNIFTAVTQKTHVQPIRKFPFSKGFSGPATPATYTRAVNGSVSGAAGRSFFLMANISSPHLPLRSHLKANGLADANNNAVNVNPSEVNIPKDAPWLPDTSGSRRFFADYLGCLEVNDLCVQAIREALASNGVAGETLLIYTSDNGMGIHRAKNSHYAAGLHVPFLVDGPGVSGGRVISEPVSTIDIVPTILDFLGIPIPPHCQGKSLWPILSGERDDFPERETVLAATNSHYSGRAVCDGRYYYMRTITQPTSSWSDPGRAMNADLWQSGPPWFNVAYEATCAAFQTQPLQYELLAQIIEGRIPDEQLYDLDTDPWCMKDLAGDAARAAKLRELRCALEKWRVSSQDLETRGPFRKSAAPPDESSIDKTELARTGPGDFPHVGLAYTTWHRPNLTTFWNSPLLGKYSSSDTSVIRQHGKWLADAGIDFVFIDWSNNIDYTPGITGERRDFEMIESTVPLLFREWQTIPGAPSLCIMLGAPNSAKRDFLAFTDGRMQRKVNQVYDDFVANPDTADQYYHYLGKPLLLIYTGTPVPTALHPVPAFDDPRFTIRFITGFVTEQSFARDGNLVSRLGYWSWEDRGPQTYTLFRGEPEACTIVASSRAQGNPGDSNHVPAIPRHNGRTFQKNFQRARDLGVKIGLVTTWNEWVAGEQPSVDVSRDLEPSEVHGSLYLSLLTREVAKFKHHALPVTADSFDSRVGTFSDDPDWVTLANGREGADFTFSGGSLDAPPGPVSLALNAKASNTPEKSWEYVLDTGFFGVGVAAGQALLIQDEQNYYRFVIQDLRGADLGAWLVKFSKVVNNVQTDLWTASAAGNTDDHAAFEDSTFYRLSTIYDHHTDTFTLRVIDLPSNTVLFSETVYDSTFTSGGFGVTTQSSTNSLFDNFAVTTLHAGTRSIIDPNP